MYKCPDCSATAEVAGNCPACNVPMNEEAQGGDAVAAPEAEPASAPETPAQG